MSSNGKIFSPFQEREALIHEFFGGVSITCQCRSKSPLLVPVMPGTGAGVECRACGTWYGVKSVDLVETPSEVPNTPPTAKLNVKLFTVKNAVQPASVVLPGART